MGDLLDLIFSNFLIVAAIVGGIISWISGMTKEKETQKRPDRNQTPKPSSYPSGPSPDLEHQGRKGEERRKGYYETKQQKLKEMADNNASSEREIGVWEPMEPNTPSGMQGQKNKSEASQLGDNGPLIESARKWDKKRLAEGILMAEVLGPPRANKPHRSHPRKR